MNHAELVPAPELCPMCSGQVQDGESTVTGSGSSSPIEIFTVLDNAFDDNPVHFAIVWRRCRFREETLEQTGKVVAKTFKRPAPFSRQYVQKVSRRFAEEYPDLTHILLPRFRAYQRHRRPARRARPTPG